MLETIYNRLIVFSFIEDYIGSNLHKTIIENNEMVLSTRLEF